MLSFTLITPVGEPVPFSWSKLSYKLLVILGAIVAIITFVVYMVDLRGPRPQQLIGTWTVEFGRGQKGKASITLDQNDVIKITGEGHAASVSSVMEGSGKLVGKELKFHYTAIAGNKKWEGDASLQVISNDHLKGYYIDEGLRYD